MEKLSFKILLLGIFFFGRPIHSSANDCPPVIEPDFCEQLSHISDDDPISFLIGLRSPPQDSLEVIPAKDFAGFQANTESDSLAEYTTRLFESHDLRWPEDTAQRATAPSQVERVYHVFATKRTVLAIALENYVVELQRWEPPIPSLIRTTTRKGKPDARTPAVNAKGQSVGPMPGTIRLQGVN